MSSLPQELPPRLRDNAHAQVVTAYNICLVLENSLQHAIERGAGEDSGNSLMYVRILGYLIHYVPTERGLKTVAEEITSRSTDSDLLELGKMYFDHYIRAFRANKGRTPKPSNYETRPSFDTLKDMTSDTSLAPPKSHAEAKEQALIRDGYRCVCTGAYDTDSVDRNTEMKFLVTSNPDLDEEPTECAHIFPASTSWDSASGLAKRGSAASMWRILHRFGYEGLSAELNSENIHRLENVMTVSFKFHVYFNQLKVWLVATEEPDKYKIEASDARKLRRYPEYIKFTTPNPAKLPVASPVYLTIHAACAKVAHMSGAAERIDEYCRDMEDSNTLDPDGSSAEMLEHAILSLQASVYD